MASTIRLSLATTILFINSAFEAFLPPSASI